VQVVRETRVEDDRVEIIKIPVVVGRIPLNILKFEVDIPPEPVGAAVLENQLFALLQLEVLPSPSQLLSARAAQTSRHAAATNRAPARRKGGRVFKWERAVKAEKRKAEKLKWGRF